jgi:hypothetical protein
MNKPNTENIYRDDLIALHEKPKETKEVESFIEEATALETPTKETTISSLEIKPQEIKVETILTPEAKQISIEKGKDDAVLKSAGIEIMPLVFGNEIKKEEATSSFTGTQSTSEIIKNIPTEETKKTEKTHESIYTQTIPDFEKPKQPSATQEDVKNDAVLKSAGIEIMPLVFDKNVENKTKDNKTEKETEKSNIENSNEVMKIAFENLPKLETPTIELKVKEVKAEEKIINIPNIPKPVLELESGEKIKETKIDAVKPKAIETAKELPIEKEPAPIQKTEEVAEETKKGELLKLNVQKIISSYQEKGQGNQASLGSPYYSTKSGPKTKDEPMVETITYGNKEEEKKALVIEIVNVQDKIKTMKDRITQIGKERPKLEKEKKEVSNKEGVDSARVSEINQELSSLSTEEKIIQTLRESILPKEYLELLIKLDKLSVHNTTITTSKENTNAVKGNLVNGSK